MADFSLQFGSYTIPNVQRVADNFADRAVQARQLPGLSGGFDLYGFDAAPGEIGQVSVSAVLIAATRDAMQAKRDELRALSVLGKQMLTWQPQGAAAPRWCWARVASISVPLEPAEHADLWQRVTLTFQAPDPHWYGAEDTDSQAVTTTGTLSVVHAGNAIALAHITIACGASQTATNPTVQRLVGATVVDEVKLTGVIGNSKALVIDARTKSVKLDGADAYANFEFLHPSWFRLAPGSNSVKVTYTGAGTITVKHYPTYI